MSVFDGQKNVWEGKRIRRKTKQTKNSFLNEKKRLFLIKYKFIKMYKNKIITYNISQKYCITHKNKK